MIFDFCSLIYLCQRTIVYKLITLYYYEDMLLREIAEVMNLSESRVSQLHHRALMSIRAKANKSKAPQEVKTSIWNSDVIAVAKTPHIPTLSNAFRPYASRSQLHAIQIVPSVRLQYLYKQVLAFGWHGLLYPKLLMMLAKSARKMLKCWFSPAFWQAYGLTQPERIINSCRTADEYIQTWEEGPIYNICWST